MTVIGGETACAFVGYKLETPLQIATMPLHIGPATPRPTIKPLPPPLESIRHFGQPICTLAKVTKADECTAFR